MGLKDDLMEAKLKGLELSGAKKEDLETAKKKGSPLEIQSEMEKEAIIKFLTTADFDAIEGWDHDRNNASNVTYYASNSSLWSTSGLNSFFLNSAALSDIAGMDNLEICLLDVNSDLTHTGGSFPPASVHYSGVVFVDHGTSSYRPSLRITHQDDAVFFGANF